MKIKNIPDLVDQLFYGEIEKIYIRNYSKRETYQLSKLSLEEIYKYDINNIDGITVENDGIYLNFC